MQHVLYNIIYIYKQYIKYKLCLLLLPTHEVEWCVSSYAEGFNYKLDACSIS